MKIINLFFIIFIVVSCKNNNEKSEILKNGDEVTPNEDGKISITKNNQEFKTEEANLLNEEGLFYAKEGDFFNAKSKLLEALNVEQNNPIILSNLGLISMELNGYEDAINYFNESLIASDSNYLPASLNLGLVFCYNHQYNEAVAISEFAISKTNDQIEVGPAYLNLAVAYLELMNCEKSKENLIKVKEIYSNVNSIQQQISNIEKQLKKVCSP